MLEEGPGFKIKRIHVKPGASLSLQMHHHRSEHWVVVSGTAKVVNGESESILRTNESTFIPAGQRHRLQQRVDRVDLPQAAHDPQQLLLLRRSPALELGVDVEGRGGGEGGGDEQEPPRQRPEGTAARSMVSRYGERRGGRHGSVNLGPPRCILGAVFVGQEPGAIPASWRGCMPTLG